MIHRHFTADCVNLVVNDPSVYDWVRGPITGYLDLSGLVQNPNNYFLMGEHGGVVFLQHQPGLYEAHTQILPAGRGQWAVEIVNECVDYMFTHTDAMELVTKVPLGNLGARALVRKIPGNKIDYRLKNGWVHDGKVVPADIFGMRVQDWMAHTPGLEQSGQWFHDRLVEEYAKVGKEHKLHDEDATHDRYVGAAIQMIMGGQPQKAVVLYNGWASISGYAPLSIVTMNPLVIDIQESLIVVRDNSDFWVM